MNIKIIKYAAITVLSIVLFTLYVFPFKTIDVNDIDVVFDSHFTEDNSWEINSCIHMANPKFTVVDYDCSYYAYYGTNMKNNMTIPARKDFTVIQLTTPYYIYDYDYHSEMVDGKNILVIDRLGTRLSSSRNNVGYDNYLYFDTYYDGYRIA